MKRNKDGKSGTCKVCTSENGKLWREKKITFNDLIEMKNEKIIESKYIDKYWQEFLKVISREKKKLF